MAEIKQFRKNIDAQIVHVEDILKINLPVPENDDSVSFLLRTNAGRELALVRTKLQEAKMWAGKVLEVIGNEFPAELADKAQVQ